ncbi:hypothetical protein NC651_002873 [Populus alba x Populus x berolinensis]|nr:hypothetical protein NC651_002873 [Populus alba x Populus x berolinensis]
MDRRRNRVSFIRLICRKLRTTIGLQFMDFDLRRDIPGLRYILVKLLCLSSNALIQLGDVLDRGEEEIPILPSLHSSGIREKAQGGGVELVNGNHESMNVEVDFLAYSEDHQYDWENAFLGWIGESKRRVEDRRLSQNHWGPWNLVKRQKEVFICQIDHLETRWSISMSIGTTCCCTQD